MSNFSISIEPLNVHGLPKSMARKERATIGRLKILANSYCATEGMDLHQNTPEEGPLVAGYPLAEWLAWNWWRLRWEAAPIGRSSDHAPGHTWLMSHALSNVGSGYCWPDVSISSDGFLTQLTWRPWNDISHATFRYFGPDRSAGVQASAFEQAVGEFISATLEQLHEARVPPENLKILWEELREERDNEQSTRFRRMEARIGADPDEREEDEITALLSRAEALGEAAFEEIASDPIVQTRDNGMLLTDRRIEDVAAEVGFDTKPSDAVRLDKLPAKAPWGAELAWKAGVGAARALRSQEGLGLDPVEDSRLCQLGAVVGEALQPNGASKGTVCFMLDEASNGGKAVFRSANATGRRFELARLIGDRVVVDDGCLFPATMTGSYRQKTQRAFAAELLCPWEAAEPMLEEAESEDDAIDVANHFGVSPLLLLNRIEDNVPR